MKHKMAMIMMMAALAVGCAAAQALDLDLLIPKPQQVVKSSGTCTVPDTLGVSNEFQDPRLDAQLVRTFPGRKVAPGKFLSIKKTPMEKGDEASELKISPDSIEIRAAAPAGAFYALKTLEQLARDGAPLPCGTISDWPAMGFRGGHLQAGWQVDALKQTIVEMAELKYNKLVFEYDSRLPWKHGAADAYTVEESRALAELAKENFIEFIPLVDSLGHMQPYLWLEEYTSLREQPDSTADLCPQNPEGRKFVRELWDFALAPLPDKGFVHISGDETFYTKPCPKCKPIADVGRRGELYRDYFADLSTCMTSRGKRSLLWHDMLIKNPEALKDFPRDIVICYWDYTGTDGDLPSPYAKYNVKGECDSQRQDLFGPYWQPNRSGRYDPFPYLKFFGDQGFKTIAASTSSMSSWPCGLGAPAFFNNQRFALEAQKQSKSCLGMLNTTWGRPGPGIWLGIAAGADFAWHPRAETFPDYVQRFAANILRRPDWGKTLLRLSDLQEGKATGDVPSLDGEPGFGASRMAKDFARILGFTIDYMRLVLDKRSAEGDIFRSGIPGTPVTLGLTPAANGALNNALPPMAGCVTATSGSFDFHGLPFKLDDQHVVSLSTNTPDKPVSLPLNRAVSGLVFWDTCYNAWPDMTLARMKVNYVDGANETFAFIGGANMLDWTATDKIPKDKASCIAGWSGRKDTSERITTWLTYWRNPSPEKQIKSIELSSLPSQRERQSITIFLGITAMVGAEPAPKAQLAQKTVELEKLESWVKDNFQRWMKKRNLDEASKALFSSFNPKPVDSNQAGSAKKDSR